VVHLRHTRRPFADWHNACLFGVLDREEQFLSSHGLSRDIVRAAYASDSKSSFQCVAERLIRQKRQKPYYPDSRVRQKLYIWKLTGVPAILERRILSNFQLVRKWCAPRVLAAYFKAVWNGRVTDSRMKGLLPRGSSCRPCVLNCGYGIDEVEHYGRCRVYWAFASSPRPSGLGLPSTMRSAEAFLLVSDLHEEDIIRLALGIDALHCTVQSCRHSSEPLDGKVLLKLWAHKAASGTRAAPLLKR